GDEHTILRSWAVKDFAPNVPQYVQIFRPETKMHIEHAEVVVCEDEFKYSLLANNCICPGISTFITLLMHTSRGEEGQKSSETWHKVYGFHSGNEIYDIRIRDSKFFGEYIGKSFIFASFHAYRTYGVGLVAVKSEGLDEKIRLNPGQHYYLNPMDTVYYMALTNEESLVNFRKGMSAQRQKANVASAIANIGAVAVDLSDIEKNEMKPGKKRNRLLKIKKAEIDRSSKLLVVLLCALIIKKFFDIIFLSLFFFQFMANKFFKFMKNKTYRTKKTYPPLTSYICTGFTICHILNEQRPICCLEIACEHCCYRTANEYNWKNPAIIVAADRACSGLYNLIIPLRAYYRPVHELQPIILLLELEETETPNPAFLDIIAWFPSVYWMQGKISSLENLLKAGVCRANNVVVTREGALSVEEHLADCATIVTVQKIHRMFPNLRMITELTHASNMRFMQFDADDQCALRQSIYEKKERKRGSSMPYMFRLPFAQGGVFSASMLDRLLYQAHVKSYVVDFIRLLLGIDQSQGSGYLTSFTIKSEDLWIGTYGRLYQKLCASVADIPIGLYRTMQMDDSEATVIFLKYEGKHSTISYVIINPSLDITLEAGDIVLVYNNC
ncbi:unnamed protein product, partial [Thelazia callipaeda]|uniref:BK_channel_a domain-containing protein n=1 Tax=Thelazia callipaeda TaxID=103827 RepID=A0A0N5CKT8_THECL